MNDPDSEHPNPPALTIAFRGHPGIRASDTRAIEFLESEEWVDRPAVLGLGATYDPAALAALRGRVAATLEVNGIVDRFEATIAPYYHRGTPLVFRRDTKVDAKSLAWQCSKAASDLDPALVEALRTPGAAGTLQLAAISGSEIPPGTLTIIAMPIGHQADLPPRALDVLSSVDVILAEDTRVAAQALRWRGITTPIESCHEQNERGRATEVTARLAQGQRLALITDAGTPLVSDPGYLVIQAAVESGARITAVPGPSAALVAITLSGLPTASFRFAGFLPRRDKERARLFDALLRSEDTTAVFESSHRIKATLEALSASAPDRRIALCKDLTKRTEEVLRGTAATVAAELCAREDVRGEYTLVIGPSVASDAPDPNATTAVAPSVPIDVLIRALLEENCPTAPIVKAWQHVTAIPRDEAYARVQAMAREVKSKGDRK